MTAILIGIIAFFVVTVAMLLSRATQPGPVPTDKANARFDVVLFVSMLVVGALLVILLDVGVVAALLPGLVKP